MEHKEHFNLTDEIRTTIIRLVGCGWKTQEISDLLNVSKSAINYTVQAHNAVKNEDWKTAYKLLDVCVPAVQWALSAQHKALPNEPVELADGVKKLGRSEPESFTEDDVFYNEVLDELRGIKSLLSEIISILK